MKHTARILMDIKESKELKKSYMIDPIKNNNKIYILEGWIQALEWVLEK